MAPRFVDRVVIHARAGSGGNGCASVHREKFKPLGGPDGGNGGRGGSIVLVVDPQVHTLLDFHFHPHVVAPSGKQGAGSNRDGAAGSDLQVKVPDGTVVLDENGRLLADLVGSGTRFEAAAGGRGGLGNAALASRARKAPGFALLGENGQVRDLTLELKTVADVGLVGFPSAGKSSLVSAISAAKPKVADYPFTTIEPVLGVVDGPDARQLTVADVPGLIEGAAEGAGLGHTFLAHLERARLLLHVVDASEPDLEERFATIDRELRAYGAGLADRPQILVLNKADLLAEAPEPKFDDPRVERVVVTSCATGEGIADLRSALFDLCAVEPDEAAVDEPSIPEFLVYRPRPRRGAGFRILRTDRGYRVVGRTPSREELEDALRRIGVKRGAEVEVDGEELEWQ
jgi:GTPase